MDFRFTDEQELLVQSLTELLEREAPENAIAELDEKHEFPARPWKALADNGILALGIPEQYGGTPADILTQTLVCEILGKYAFPLGIIYSLGMITIRDILQFGSAEMRAEVLGGFVRGDPPIALGITEPQAGSDSAALKTSATYEGDNVIFNGQKMYCTLSGIARYIMLMTRDQNGENPYESISMWLLPTNTPGLSFHLLDKVGWWTVPTYEVFIDHACVPRKNLIGAENCGWQQLMANFEIERLALAAASLGAAEAAYEDASFYANQRVQFGQPIGSYQAIQHKITDMALKIENMKNLTYKVAWMMDNQMSVRVENALCKLYVAQAAFEVCDDAMQIFGGLGYMMDQRIQRLWRDVRLMRIGGGTDEIMYNIAGPQLLKKARK
ncbi:MAG TPA: acyl-CoA dehydrogenase family protein [Anaerolineaceae bacterium]|nr:acyl-CoA dehydrogenase family protein [Anaerolineaceae bacterium]